MVSLNSIPLIRSNQNIHAMVSEKIMLPIVIVYIVKNDSSKLSRGYNNSIYKRSHTDTNIEKILADNAKADII